MTIDLPFAEITQWVCIERKASESQFECCVDLGEAFTKADIDLRFAENTRK